MKKKSFLVVEGEPGVRPPRGRPRARRRILVVDDDPNIRELNRDALVDFGYAVDTAKDGAAAWHAVVARRYDLLVTDNNMPKVSGVELLQKLHDARFTLPVIMATGTLPQEEFNRRPWLQPDATLLKPYSTNEMMRTVHHVLQTPGRLCKPLQASRHRATTNDAVRKTRKGGGTSGLHRASPVHRILVVARDPDLGLLYTDALPPPNYFVGTVADGAAAWQALSRTHFSLLITDNRTPTLSGLGLLRKVRAARLDLPVIMAAATFPAGEFQIGPGLHPDATLLHPFTVAKLLKTVKEVLSRRGNVPALSTPPRTRIGRT